MNRSLPVAALALLAGCGGGLTDAQQKAKVVTGMHDSMQADLVALHQAAVDLQTAAPDHAWSATADAAAITAMKAAWTNARTAYEHTEGALAPIFPDLDVAIDERYDGFLETLTASGGDQNLFDDQGVTGMHGIERILFSDSTPQRVVDKEKTLVGYAPARFPSTMQEAADFKSKLCAKLIADTQKLEDQWQPAQIDLAGAFQGLIDLMKEQQEKINNASLGLEESRYSQRTMVDIRDNLSGTKAIYAQFRPWLLDKKTSTLDGAAIDVKLAAGFDRLGAAYDQVSGDALPLAPTTWSAEQPSAADLATPFGQLYTAVVQATDPNVPGSVAAEMNEAGVLLGFSKAQ